jgi:hypothetical protein
MLIDELIAELAPLSGADITPIIPRLQRAVCFRRAGGIDATA